MGKYYCVGLIATKIIKTIQNYLLHSPPFGIWQPCQNEATQIQIFMSRMCGENQVKIVAI